MKSLERQSIEVGLSRAISILSRERKRNIRVFACLVDVKFISFQSKHYIYSTGCKSN